MKNKIQFTQKQGLFEATADFLREQLSPPESIDLPDWKLFNEMTGGLRPNEFSIFCGSTGIGKTTFLANLSQQLIMRQSKQLIMSIETGTRDYLTRIASVFAEFDFNAVNKPDRKRLEDFVEKHYDVLTRPGTYFTPYEDRVTVEQLQADISEMHESSGVEVVLIDNLNYLLEVKRSTDLIVEMDRVIHSLIVFVKTCPVHIVMVMHSRKPEGNAGADYGRIENEFQIKGSSTAVQEAQNVFLFNRPKREDVENGKREHTDRELRIAKMRRRGLFVGHEIIFGSTNTRYAEKGAVDFLGRDKFNPSGSAIELPKSIRRSGNHSWRNRCADEREE